MSVGIRQAAARRHGWTPLDLSSLALWLDADDAATITMSGGNVTTWADKSGAGNHVSGASGPTRTLKQNGRDVCSFTASSALERTGTSLMPSAGSVAFVVRFAAAPPTYLAEPVGLMSGDNPRPMDHWQSATENAMLVGNDWADVNPGWCNMRAQTAWCSLVTVLGGAYAVVGQYLDGALLRSVVANGPWSTSGQALQVGMRTDAQESFVGDLAEAVITNAVWSSQDIADWTAYTRTKWGTP